MPSKFQNLYASGGVLSVQNASAFSFLSSHIAIACSSIALVLVIVYFKFQRRSKIEKSTDDSQVEETNTKEDYMLPSNFARKHLEIMQKISYRISEDRNYFMQTVFQEQYAFQAETSNNLFDNQLSLKRELELTLEHRRQKQDQRFDDIARILEEFKANFAIKTKDCTSATSETDSDQLAEVQNKKLEAKVTATVREFYCKLVSEARLKGQDVLHNINRYLEQSRKDIERELAIFNSVAMEENGKVDFERSNGSLIAAVDNVEKNLLETVKFMNLQRFEMENLNKTIKHFNNKFHYVAAKFDTYWRMSNVAYNHASQQLEGSEKVCTSAVQGIGDNLKDLLQQFEIIGGILSDLKNTMQSTQAPSAQPDTQLTSANTGNHVSELGDVPAKSDEEAHDFSFTEGAWLKEIENCNEKLEDVMVATDIIRERIKLCSQSSETLDSLHDLVRSVASGCGSVLSALQGIGQKSQRPKEKLSLKSVRGPENLNSQWLNKKNQAQKQIKQRECLLKKNIGQKTALKSKTDRKGNKKSNVTLSSNHQNMDLNQITVCLNDILKTNWGLRDQNTIIDEHEVRKETQRHSSNNAKSVEKKEHPMTGISTENFWNDISSDFLVPNSEDSD